MERRMHPVGEVLIIPMTSSASPLPQESARPQTLPLHPSSPPPAVSRTPPVSMCSSQLQDECFRRAPRAASPENDSAKPHRGSIHISPSVSSLSSPPPPLSLSSPLLQAEFLKRASRGLRTVSCDTDDVLTSPSSPQVSPFTSTTTSPFTSPPQPLSPTSPFSSPVQAVSPSETNTEGRSGRLSLSSPELLTELRQSHSRPMKHVSASKGLTTVFSGRGRSITTSSPTPATGPTNQSLRLGSMANGRQQAGPRLSNGT
ncbi:proline-rich receptor-like protein kinase PERK12 [Esox lucius]|uniref:proline-rich receptor-like protein kinase PERK12 n=1 Tax=Esox lucius TaxID=8010 RepID=UPI000576FF2F|nr:proline-rich receptor-like protein kinase PERK12 [Esox lucius]